MIRNPNEIQEGAKKIRMLIAGYPGIGKSTLALSAPAPCTLTWTSASTASSPGTASPHPAQGYDEILEDLTPSTSRDFDTLVF